MAARVGQSAEEPLEGVPTLGSQLNAARALRRLTQNLRPNFVALRPESVPIVVQSRNPIGLAQNLIKNAHKDPLVDGLRAQVFNVLAQSFKSYINKLVLVRVWPSFEFVFNRGESVIVFGVLKFSLVNQMIEAARFGRDGSGNLGTVAARGSNPGATLFYWRDSYRATPSGCHERAQNKAGGRKGCNLELDLGRVSLS